MAIYLLAGAIRAPWQGHVVSATTSVINIDVSVHLDLCTAYTFAADGKTGMVAEQDGDTTVLAIDPPLSGVPASGSTFTLIPTGQSSQDLLAHAVRQVVVPGTTATLGALTLDNATGSFSATFRGRFQAGLSATLGDITAAISMNSPLPPSIKFVGGPIRDGNGKLVANGIRFAIARGVILSAALENATGSFSLHSSGQQIHSAVSGTALMAGAVAGQASAGDGFNAALGATLADAIGSFSATVSLPGASAARVIATLDDAVGAIGVSFRSRSNIGVAAALDSAVGSISLGVQNPNTLALVAAQLDNCVGSFSLHSQLPNVRDSSIAAILDDATASIQLGSAVQVRTARLGAQLGDVVGKFLFTQGQMTGSWPGFSDKFGLRVRRLAKPLRVPGKREDPA